MKNRRFLTLVSVLLLLSFVLGLVSCTKTDGEKSDGTGTSAGTAAGTSSDTAEVTVGDTSAGTPSYTIPEYEPLKYSGRKIRTKRVSVHDPSVVYDSTNGKYYLFGSHKAWAVSDDLASWNTFSMPSLEKRNVRVFKDSIAWSKHGNSNYDVEGNMWAPDVIYNEAMGKWCMYMSINGDNYYSSIVLLTSDTIDGEYEYVGPIVYSGFIDNEQLAETNFTEVTGDTDIKRYHIGKSWNASYGPNAIDPCVLYDKDGQLWMSYGSWFGGIFLLKLDNNTGLRDLTQKYETKTGVSDKYFGLRISGGYGGTGEGSYIVWDPVAGYYYLYMSYCGLDATDDFSGYHIRLFRSENIEGPYVDSMGNGAIVKKEGDSQSQKGIKLFGNYSFSSLKGNGENSENGYMSGGHNSAFIDSDGQHYLVYHTRFNVGQEWHEVRVHQQFMNEDGWPVTAVYEFQGSVISESGYSTEEIAGDYEYVDHGIDATTRKTGMLPIRNLTLNADGTITGDAEGTWDQHTGSDGKGYYVTMKIGSSEYKGVFFKQYDESKQHNEVMTFTLIGNNDHSIWGSKVG